MPLYHLVIGAMALRERQRTFRSHGTNLPYPSIPLRINSGNIVWCRMSTEQSSCDYTKNCCDEFIHFSACLLSVYVFMTILSPSHSLYDRSSYGGIG